MHFQEGTLILDNHKQERPSDPGAGGHAECAERPGPFLGLPFTRCAVLSAPWALAPGDCPDGLHCSGEGTGAGIRPRVTGGCQSAGV